ncbi:MAG: restriction endonuclease subunit S [Candidatus Riflebacteria bacterium]
MKIKLKKMADAQTGYSFRVRIEPDSNGSLAVIQMKDLRADNTVDLSSLTRVDLPELKSHHLVEPGDLIFRSRGLETSAAMLSENPGQAIVSAPLLRIRVKKAAKILPEYLNWYLSQSPAQAYFNSYAIGTAQKIINKEVLEELEIFVPTLRMQKKIVELAALAESEQKLTEKISEKRKQYVSALLMQAAKGEADER